MKERKQMLLFAGFILVYLLILLLPHVVSNEEDVFYTPFHIIKSNGIGNSLLTSIFIFFILHAKRVIRLGRNGAMRVMMMPISPYTYFIAHLMFVFSTLCLIISMFSLSYLIAYLWYAMQAPVFENHLIYMLELAPLSEWILPLELSQLCLNLLGLFTLSLIFCMCTSACYSVELMGKIILVGMVLLIPILLVLSYLLTEGFKFGTSTNFISLGFIILDFILLRIEFRWLRLRKVAG